MISLTSTAQGETPGARHGRSRACAAYHPSTGRAGGEEDRGSIRRDPDSEAGPETEVSGPAGRTVLAERLRGARAVAGGRGRRVGPAARLARGRGDELRDI